MPPKQQSKADIAKKQKIVEDKTFGLKNKNKSKNVQKYVQNLKQSVQPKPDPSKTAAKVSIDYTVCSNLFFLPISLFIIYKFYIMPSFYFMSFGLRKLGYGEWYNY